VGKRVSLRRYDVWQMAVTIKALKSGLHPGQMQVMHDADRASRQWRCRFVSICCGSVLMDEMSHRGSRGACFDSSSAFMLT